MDRIGVGFLGAGPATQAIHLPVLATLADRFRVISVMDVNPHVAETVAARCGARPAATTEAVCGDPAVQIVVVCSPNQFHAAQVIAACRAGKRVVLCEKPLATTRTEADEIKRAAIASGTHVVVGTMHAYDSAWHAARDKWAALGETAMAVRSAIFLPGNDHFIDQATDQVLPPQGPPRPTGNPDDPVFQARRLRAAILGLAIHDIPLIREAYPAVGEVLTAAVLRPFGYALTMTKGRQQAELVALMPGAWAASWQLSFVGRQHELRAAFTPSYVLAGSAKVELAQRHRRQTFETAESGYEVMWSHIGSLCRGEAEPLIPLQTAIDDLAFALDLADAVDRGRGIVQ